MATNINNVVKATVIVEVLDAEDIYEGLDMTDALSTGISILQALNDGKTPESVITEEILNMCGIDEDADEDERNDANKTIQNAIAEYHKSIEQSEKQ